MAETVAEIDARIERLAREQAFAVEHRNWPRDAELSIERANLIKRRRELEQREHWNDERAGPAHHREARDDMPYASFYFAGFCPECARRLDGSAAELDWDADYCWACLTVWWPLGRLAWTRDGVPVRAEDDDDG